MGIRNKTKAQRKFFTLMNIFDPPNNDPATENKASNAKHKLNKFADQSLLAPKGKGDKQTRKTKIRNTVALPVNTR